MYSDRGRRDDARTLEGGGAAMKTMRAMRAAAAVVIAAVCSAPAFALAPGAIQDFEDGTTQGWVVGLLGAPHPAPPLNVPSGGPAGADDNYLRLQSSGGAGAGNRLVAINLGDFAGDYLGLGVARIGMDLRNEGNNDLSLRLYLENPRGGPPTDDAITPAFALPAGGGWVHAEFAVDAASLIALAGDVNALLGDVTALRMLHGSADGFPGEAIAAQLGVDNIVALRDVPEPPVAGLAALALIGLAASRRRPTRG
jgi:hypothetical protein